MQFLLTMPLHSPFSRLMRAFSHSSSLWLPQMRRLQSLVPLRMRRTLVGVLRFLQPTYEPQEILLPRVRRIVYRHARGLEAISIIHCKHRPLIALSALCQYHDRHLPLDSLDAGIRIGRTSCSLRELFVSKLHNRRQKCQKITVFCSQRCRLYPKSAS